MVSAARHECVPIADITIPKGRRTLNHENVKSLAQSIRAVGLLQPIGLTADYRLIFGLHRIEAHKLLDLKTIDCRIIEAAELETQLAELDENLSRTSLSALEWSQALKKRKEVYEALHPETKHGGDRKSESTGSSAHERALDFASDTAARTGQSPSTIRRDVQLAEEIPEDVQEAIVETDPKAKKADLQKLAALPDKAQRKVAEKLKTGKARTVKEATPKKKPPKDAPDAGGYEPHEALKPLDKMDALFSKMLEHYSAAERILGKKDEGLVKVHAGLDSGFKALTGLRNSLKKVKRAG